MSISKSLSSTLLAFATASWAVEATQLPPRMLAESADRTFAVLVRGKSAIVQPGTIPIMEARVAFKEVDNGKTEVNLARLRMSVKECLSEQGTLNAYVLTGGAAGQNLEFAWTKGERSIPGKMGDWLCAGGD